MTEVKPAPTLRAVPLAVARRGPKGGTLLALMRTTDPKQIGLLYLTTPFAFFMAGGAGGVGVRGGGGPAGAEVLSPRQDNPPVPMRGPNMLPPDAPPHPLGRRHTNPP